MKRRIILGLCLSLVFSFGYAQKKRKKATTTSVEKAVTAHAFKGFFDFTYDASNGQLLLQVNRATQIDQDFLYINGLSAGIGSNDIGLDRGQLGNERVVHFTKMGDKLMLVQPNLDYRSTSSNALEQASIAQAFAKSVLFGFPIKKTTATHYTIDLTPFLMQDAHGVAQRLKRSKQGSYSIDKSRSAISLARTKNFPQNSEFDVLLTFKGTPQGGWIRSVTPSPNSVTVHQHHSFVQLPEVAFEPRKFDPRSGAIPFSYNDYSTPVNESTRQVFTLRHRLEKKDPNASLSEAVEPIVYYLDNGTPEPVRSALLEGGRWWNQAFEAAGFKDAFQLKILPDDADPMDVRYNVIQWVHRSTRGWSYGASVVDPRSGEILKGHVSLGSLRIRQDFMIAQALTNQPYAATDENDRPMLEMALARIRQLSAHEIGHTLGFTHNFAASVKDRASVMDYPHPTLEINEGQISYANAYAVGIGDWDKVSVRYSYSDFPTGTDETAALNTILEDGYAKGHRFIADRDARPIGGAHPYAHLWDNGATAVEEFNHLLAVRKIALSNFSIDQLKTGEPLSILRDRLVPLYFLHRYQLEAVVKLIGGQDYDYGVKGAPSTAVKSVEATTQRAALNALIGSLQKEILEIPDHIRTLLPPHAFGYGATRESFATQTGLTFDALGAAHTLSDAVLSMVLNEQRAARLVQQKAFDAQQLGFQETLNLLITAAFKQKHSTQEAKALQKVVQGNLLQQMMRLGQAANIPHAVRAEVHESLYSLSNWLKSQRSYPYANYYRNLIQNYFDHPAEIEPLNRPKIPDGSPIGSGLRCQ
ncbi:MAG: zinc-dependent metalloprotease [Flavobacteriaceae bacterium]